MSGNGLVAPSFTAGNVLPDVKTLSTGGNTFNYASNMVGGKKKRVKAKRGTKTKRATKGRKGSKSKKNRKSNKRR